jgi:hypothetical protein
MWKYGTVCMKILTKQINNKGVQIKLKKKRKKNENHNEQTKHKSCKREKNRAKKADFELISFLISKLFLVLRLSKKLWNTR